MAVGTLLSFIVSLYFPCFCNITSAIIITILDRNLAIIQPTLLRGCLNLKWNGCHFKALQQISGNIDFERCDELHDA